MTSLHSCEGLYLPSVTRYSPTHVGRDTNSSFNLDGSMKSDVSNDEGRTGLTGGGLRHSPRAFSAAGVQSGGGWAAQHQQAFSADGTMMAGVSRDETASGLTGGRRRMGTAERNRNPFSRKSAGRKIPRPQNEGFMYGSR